MRNEKNTPVIIITAKSQLEDKLDLFEVGADDYLVKPFDLEELLARLKAVLRRGVIDQLFTFQDIEMNFPKKRVFKSKKEVHLTLKEFQILEILVQNRGVSMSRTDLITYLRGEDSIRDSDEKLDVYICNIRKKLDKNLIETVKGFGYRI
ncbi:MAG: response regulator transcription factor [Patescibacteria group bacterium]|nr:response regulator transcription factor [Patescibacteria group bacterium]